MSAPIRPGDPQAAGISASTGALNLYAPAYQGRRVLSPSEAVSIDRERELRSTATLLSQIMAALEGVKQTPLAGIMSDVNDYASNTVQRMVDPYHEPTTAYADQMRSLQGPPTQYTDPADRVAYRAGQSLPFIAMGGGGLPGMATGLAGSYIGERVREDGGSGLAAAMLDMVTDIALMSVTGGAGLAVLPAFVGSPNRWDVNDDLGRLGTDMRRIGSGEGAQAFGYGHYSAESKAVAKEYAGIVDSSKGNVYGLLHDVNYEDLLDLDAPLSQQSPKVRAALKELLGDVVPVKKADGKYGVTFVRPDGSGDVYWPIDTDSPERALELFTGNDVIKTINGPNGSMNDVATSKALREAGIPGSMYYDQNTRARVAGEIIGVTEKNGKFFSRIKKPVQNPGDLKPYDEITRSMPFDTADEAMQWAREQTQKGTRNFVMFGDDLTYVDPTRTDPRLIGDAKLGEPYRTVPKPAGPAPVVSSKNDIDEHSKWARGVGIQDFDRGEVSGFYDPDASKITIDPSIPKFLRDHLVFHEQGHHAISKVGKEVWEPYYDWFNSLPANSPMFRFDAMQYKRADVDEFIADAYASSDIMLRGKMRVELDPYIGTGMEEIAVPPELMKTLDKMEDQLGLWKKRRARLAKKSQ